MALPREPGECHEVAIIDRHVDFLKLKADWNAWVRDCNRDLLFLTHEFIDTEWVAHPDLDPFVVLGKCGGKVRSVFPLIRHRIRFYSFPVDCLSTMNFGYPDRFDIVHVADPEISVDSILEYLRQERKPWHLLVMKSVLATSDTARLLPDAARRRRFKVAVREGYESPYVPVDGRWDDYVRDRSRNFRKKLRGLHNKIREEGIEVRYREFRGVGEMEEALDSVFRIDSRSWKAGTGTAMTSSARTKEYWRTLTGRFAAEEQVRIWVLYIGESPAAYEYHIVRSDKTYTLKASYDSEFRKYSPGVLLGFKSMESFWTRGVREIELLGNSDEFKTIWTDRTRRHVNIYIFNNGLYANFVHAMVFKVGNWVKGVDAFVRTHGTQRGRALRG